MEKSDLKHLSSSDIEYVEVKIKIPKPLYEFVKALAQFYQLDTDQFFETELKTAIESVLDGMSGAYMDKEYLIELYHLKEIIEDC